MTEEQKIDFFLGTHSAKGFISLFDRLSQPPYQSVLLKGAPGLGHSRLIQTAVERFDINGYVEQYRCALFPDKLDGICFTHKMLTLLQSFFPHSLTVHFPLAYENEFLLYDCVDKKEILFEKERLLSLYTSQMQLFKRCYGFLQGVSSLLQDSCSMLLPYTDTDKIARYAKRMCLKELRKTENNALEKKRFLSSITPNGVITFFETAQKLCPKIYAIHDEYGCAQRLLLSAIRSHAQATGQTFYSCYCPLCPFEKLDHLLLPEAGVGFVTVHRHNHLNFTPHRNIHFNRFTDANGLRSHKQRLSLNRKAAASLLNEAILSLKGAAKVQDEIAAVYQNALSCDQISQKTGELMKLLSFYAFS